MPVIRVSADDHQLIRDDVVSVDPAPVELKWDMNDKEFEEYCKIAWAVIPSNKEFRDESLRRFLKENNILVYSTKNVGRFLKFKIRKEIFEFRYLIESNRYKEMRLYTTLNQFGGVEVADRVFCEFIPIKVLERINLVLTRFPELYCLISNGNDCPERFVAITFGKDSEVFVVDMWNKDKLNFTKREE